MPRCEHPCWRRSTIPLKPKTKTIMNETAQALYCDKFFLPLHVESSRHDSALTTQGPTTTANYHIHSQLLALKRKLLRRALEETPGASLFKPLCAAANEAEKLAWSTCCPLLVFPCLFEERGGVVREQFHIGHAGQTVRQPLYLTERVAGIVTHDPAAK